MSSPEAKTLNDLPPARKVLDSIDPVTALHNEVADVLQWTAAEAPNQSDADRRFPWWRTLSTAFDISLEAHAHPRTAMIEDAEAKSNSIPMLLTCPSCSARHIDEGEFATKPHHTHACQTCGMVWRPAIVPTVGVRFLPGYKNAP